MPAATPGIQPKFLQVMVDFTEYLTGREFAIKVQEGLTSFHTEGIDQGGELRAVCRPRRRGWGLSCDV